MTKRFVTLMLSASLLLAASAIQAQEVTVHHGFLFFASESYTMDEKTFGINDDGNKFEEVIKENKKALSQFHSYESMHTVANVCFGLGLGAAALGGVYYMLEDDLSETFGESMGMIMFVTAGGFVVASVVFEFLAYGSISGAADTYNHELMDEGPAYKFDPVPTPMVAVTPRGGHLALTWNF